MLRITSHGCLILKKEEEKKRKCYVLMQPDRSHPCVKEEHLASKIIDTGRSSLEYKYWMETMKMV